LWIGRIEKIDRSLAQLRPVCYSEFTADSKTEVLVSNQTEFLPAHPSDVIDAWAVG